MLAKNKTPAFELLRLYVLMVDLVPSGQASIARVARELGTSPRTIQRRLAEHGLTFRDVLAAVRLGSARRLLVQTDLPVQAIAARLGYRKPGAFARAFARWEGLSPSAFRRGVRRTRPRRKFGAKWAEPPHRSD